MTDNSTPLPEFSEPPVTEVALSIQFEPVELSPAQLGIFALRMKELGYSRIEQHPPLQPIIEQFGPRSDQARVVFEFGPPAVRHWFISDDRQRLIQVQQDRFIHNWRKTGSKDRYPRYEGIRETFVERFGEFDHFLAQERLGPVQPNQVEVTYVNHVRSVRPQPIGSPLANVVGIAGASFTDGFLPKVEATRAGAQFVIDHNAVPVGRLYVNAHTGVDRDTGDPVVVVNMTARGKPLTPGFEGAMAFMDLGREWVVRGFADATTSDMHALWGRTT